MLLKTRMCVRGMCTVKRRECRPRCGTFRRREHTRFERWQASGRVFLKGVEQPSVRLAGTLVVACVAVGAIEAGGQRPVPNVTLMASAARYVEAYEQQLGAIIGDEDYTQVVSNPQAMPRRRRLQSEFALVRLPTDDHWWIGIREVLQVDGRPVSNRAEQILALLKLPFGAARDQWQALQEESARYNIGSIRRTLNIPTFVLLFMRGDNQHRFQFDTPRPDGPQVVVQYRELDRPTFIRDEQGNDEPSRGWIRVDPRSGAITATRLEVGLARTDVHARIDVHFGRDPKLQLWLPAEMRGYYSAPSGERVEEKARYRNFKRFEVEASWRVK